MCYLVRLLGLRRACRVSYRRKTPVEHHRNVTAHAVPQIRLDKVALGTRPFRLSGCQFGILFRSTRSGTHALLRCDNRTILAHRYRDSRQHRIGIGRYRMVSPVNT